MPTTLLCILLLAVGAVLLLASKKPNEFRVSRSAVIPAPPSAVFEQVNNLRKWNAWSPWARLDPNMRTAYEGPEAGPGAVLRWSGDKRVGEGSMTIVESRPVELITFELNFLKPFKATNSAEFNFRPDSGGTAVTWSMLGQNSFISKIVSLFMNCEEMVGKQFDTGLSQLAEVVTKG